MFQRSRRSWLLMREAWQVLRQDRGLVLFPILSGFFSLLALASFAVPFFLLMPWDQINHGRTGATAQSADAGFGPWSYLFLFLFYLVTYFIIVFFNSGLVACVRMRLAGEEPTVRDSLSFSMANVGRIFAWALLSATIGTVLKSVEERLGWLGRIIIRLIGVAWSLATAFVVPVLVYERVGPFEALKRSAAVFKRTWGEAVIANIGLSAAFSLLAFVPTIAALVLSTIVFAVLQPSAPALSALILVGTILLCIIYWIGLATIQSALQGIFLTACYEYAITGEVPSVFTREYIVEAWRPKRK